MPAERKPNRTADQIVADLQAKIAAVQARAERKKRMANSAVKLARGASKLLEKAVTATDDAAMKKALQDASIAAHACVAIEGGVMHAAVTERAAEKRRRTRGIEPKA